MDPNMATLFGLDGKRFMILGGGQGMGEATARLLASLGAGVAIVDKEADRAERVAADLAKSGANAMPFSVDVTDDDALIATIARIERELGPLDGMATIIGMAAWSPLVEMSMETWDSEQRRNLRYFFLAAREVARGLMQRKAPGSIVCVGSIDGLRSAPLHAAYGAAKAGLSNLARTMAVEWSGHGIRVNVVAPGAIVTPRVPYTDDEAEARITANVPMQRRGTVDDVAKVAAFFLSDLSSYVTGQTLAADGGVLAANPFFNAAPPPA
jgi:3-oxoacyl-[acyl-carrier protein] reductase